MFKIIQHLLPKSIAWNITHDTNLRRFIEGLANAFQDFRDFFDGVWNEIHPDTTTQLDAWENQFGLSNTVTDTQERRDRLNAVWQALGGQSPKYIQDTLQAAGFNVYVHEWWTPGSEPALDIIASATPRDPFLYLNDQVTPLRYLSLDGAADMQDGDSAAMDGSTFQPSGYPLVNKIYVYDPDYVTDGYTRMMDGAAEAMDGGIIANGETYNLKQYAIPSDTDTHSYILYIGGQTFPNHAIVPFARKNEFETLCLKICPTQQWLGMLIDYS